MTDKEAVAKPTLHEIALMAFPKSQREMRKWYVPKWGAPEPDGTPVKWRVAVEYETRTEDTEFFEVMAVDEDEAEDLAREAFFKDHSHEDEITGTRAKELGQ